MSIWSWFLLIFASVWNWLGAWALTVDSGKRSAPIMEVLGAWIVYTVVIGAISLLAKPAGWGRVARWYFWLSLIVGGLMFARTHTVS